MAAVGIVLGLIGGAAGIAMGLAGGLIGLVVGLLGGSLGLLFHLFPVVMITLGIIWLVKGSKQRKVAEVRVNRDGPALPRKT